MKSFLLRMDDDLFEWLKVASEEDERSINKFIVKLIKDKRRQTEEISLLQNVMIAAEYVVKQYSTETNTVNLQAIWFLMEKINEAKTAVAADK